MTPRKRISSRDRLKLFTAHGGICHLCGGKIHVGERWEISHPIPLEMGGEDTDDNRRPAHYKCHRAHTSQVDIPMIRHSQRRESRHLGAHRSRTPLPCGRTSRWRKKINGEVVPR